MNHHRTTHGDEMDFGYGHYPLIDIYKDNSQKVVVMKSVQLGVSDRLIVAAMSRLHKGWSILYSLPTEELRNRVVANRIDPLLKFVPFYANGLKTSRGDSDHVGLKHIWNGSISFVGSNSKAGFVEFSADMVIIDEKDKSNQDNLKFAPDRLQASKYKYLWQVGNPSFTNYGIHASYLESDQKEWNIKCPHCNEWQHIDFFVNVINQVGEHSYRLLDSGWSANSKQDIKIYCRKCSNELDRLAKGEHIARFPERDISGYHMSSLISPTVAVSDVYAQFLKGLTDATEMQVLYNSRLGLPYEGTGEKLCAALLEAKCKDEYLMPSSASSSTGGVDVNWPQLHVRISEYPRPGVRRAAFIGTVMSWAELWSLLQRYNVRTCCIDVAPERHKVKEFQAQHPNIIWTIEYASEEITDFWRVDPDEKSARVDRTQSLDAMVSEILNGRNRLPMNFRSLDNGEYIKQMEAPTRRLDEKRKKPRYIWDEAGELDHHFHADNYDYLAMRIMREFGNHSPLIAPVFPKINV